MERLAINEVNSIYTSIYKYFTSPRVCKSSCPCSCQPVCLQVRCAGVYQATAEGMAQIKLGGENNLHHPTLPLPGNGAFSH